MQFLRKKYLFLQYFLSGSELAKSWNRIRIIYMRLRNTVTQTIVLNEPAFKRHVLRP